MPESLSRGSSPPPARPGARPRASEPGPRARRRTPSARSRARTTGVERRQDAPGEMRRAAAVHELEQTMDVRPRVARELPGERGIEAGALQACHAPANDPGLASADRV